MEGNKVTEPLIGMTINLNGDGAWPDLSTRKVIHLDQNAPPIKVAVLDKGMISGRPSVAIRLELPDGEVVIAETTARLFCGVAKMIMAKYPNLFVGD